MRLGTRLAGRVGPALALLSLVAACTSSPSSDSTPTPSRTSAPTPSASTSATASQQAPPVDDSRAEQLPEFPDASASLALPTPSTQPEVRRFIAAVFTDAQAHWRDVFDRAGLTYNPARLVLFDSQVRTGCGTESAQVGPFYCPADLTVYLDVSFFDQMRQRYGVTGDFAQAFVVAHELGHHIQRLTGVTSRVNQLQQQKPSAANALSVRTELQADCYAGVWAHSTYERGLLEEGDLDEALTAAASVGDDFLQRTATGTIRPELWTHGSSAQRQRWLRIGYYSGRPASCNTFAA